MPRYAAGQHGVDRGDAVLDRRLAGIGHTVVPDAATADVALGQPYRVAEGEFRAQKTQSAR